MWIAGICVVLFLILAIVTAKYWLTALLALAYYLFRKG